MQSEEMEQLLVGYIYGELSEEERKLVEVELERDEEWSKVLDELRRTSRVLREWEDVEPGVRHLVTRPAEGAGTGGADRRRLPWRSIVPAAAGIAAALLLVLWNARVDYEEGRFSLSLGRSPSPASLSPTEKAGVPFDQEGGLGPYVTEEDFVRSQAELVRFVAALLEESEDRQGDRFLTALAEYAKDVETRREGDLVFMDRRLGVVEEGARDLLDRVSADFPVTELRSRGGDNQ
jgi:hypothetical protein